MNLVTKLLFFIGVISLSVSLSAQESNIAPTQPAIAPQVQEPVTPVANSEENVADNATAAADASLYTPMDATPGVGMPTSAEEDIVASMDFQDQYSDLGEDAYWLNNYVLLPVITVISIFVLFLLFWVVVRYRRSANPEPSKTSHNTLIEIIWIAIPTLILLGISIPSIGLLANQFEPAPKNAVTVKAVGYQWYWGFEYPDHGEIEVLSLIHI